MYHLHLGPQTYRLAENQAANNATNPDITERVTEDLETIIEEGHVSADGETAEVVRAATDGRWFQQQEEKGVCMDDVTKLDNLACRPTSTQTFVQREIFSFL